MRGQRLAQGTVFVYPGMKNKKMERTVSRARERMHRKSSKGHAVKSNKAEDNPWAGNFHLSEEKFFPQLSDLDDFRLRSQLQYLMGTEDIFLSNVHWNHEFVMKQRENYNRLCDEQEANLAVAETQRMHRLVLGGHSKSEETPEATQRLPPHLRSIPSIIDVHKKTKQDDKQTQTREKELFTRLQQKTYVPPKELPTFEQLLSRQEAEEAEVCPTLKQSVNAIAVQSLQVLQPWLNPDKTASERALEIKQMRKKRYRHLPKEVAQLYEEESVEELYKMAQQLIKTSKPPSDEERHGSLHFKENMLKK